MGTIEKKLNSRSGASVIIALAFLLLCSMVSAVVIGAASSNAGRLAAQRETQQNYLTLRSAAELLRDDIQGMTFTDASRLWENEWCDDYSNPPAPEKTCTGGSDLQDTMGRFGDSVFQSTTPEVKNAELTIKDSDVNKIANIDDVYVVLSMNADYQLTAKFTLNGSAVTLVMTPTVDDQIERISYSCYGHDVDATETEDAYISYHTITQITHTVTVKWSTGTITKGAAS